MAHFAELDGNNVVLRVIVVNNSEILDESGNESESKGVTFCKLLHGENTNWKQTSYNSTFRKNFAGIGNTYDPTRNAFIRPQPFPSWPFVEETCNWKPPITRPDDGNPYIWDEETVSWKPL
jgi:hypothetical protein